MAGIISATSICLADIPEVEYVEKYSEIKDADGKVCGYTNLGICNVKDGNLNIREVPEEMGHVVGKLPANAGCEILSVEGDWLKISSGKVEGYVVSEYILQGDDAYEAATKIAALMGTALGSGINVRTEPNTECSVMFQMPTGEEIEVLEEMGEWTKVSVDDEEGYVFSEYLDVEMKLPSAMTLTEARFGKGVTDVRADLCSYACSFVGNRYVWGGTSLTKGTDCSGFTMQIFKKYGVNLPRTARYQVNEGQSASYSEALPGDLVFYHNGRYVHHVAIYIGNGQIVHAASTRQGIRISNATYQKIYKIKRFLPAE